MNDGRLGLRALVLALATSAVLLVWYSSDAADPAVALDPSATAGSALSDRSAVGAGSPSSSETARERIPARDASNPQRDDDEEFRDPLNTRPPRTEADFLDVYRRQLGSDPKQFDSVLVERVSDTARPLPERVALARLAWEARRPGWPDAYQAALATIGTADEGLGWAVQRWLSEDAATHIELREFIQGNLWGSNASSATSASRRRLAGSLSAAVPDHDWQLFENQLRAENDIEVVRSALIARGRSETPEAAAQLFARFGLEVPPDLYATEH